MPHTNKHLHIALYTGIVFDHEKLQRQIPTNKIAVANYWSLPLGIYFDVIASDVLNIGFNVQTRYAFSFKAEISEGPGAGDNTIGSKGWNWLLELPIERTINKNFVLSLTPYFEKCNVIPRTNIATWGNYEEKRTMFGLRLQMVACF